MKTNEIYQAVTETIINLLEEHQLSWDRPWISLDLDNDRARNPSSGQYYRGINQFLLSYLLLKKSYFKNIWMTFQQIKKAGGHVNKGEQSYPVIFYKTAFIDKNRKYYAPDTVQALGMQKRDSLGIESIGVLKLYRVFNVAQTSDLDPEYYAINPKEPLQEWEQDERVEALLRATGAQIEIKESNQAFYSSQEDKIVLPLRSQFKGAAAWAGTAFHELGHWSAHPSRLNRESGESFGDIEYGKEELICELGSAFTCAALGIRKTITNNAAYLQSWLGILKQDHRALIRMASQAQQVADYILSFTKPE